MQEKPSLARYVLAILQKDAYHEVFYRAVNAWIQLFRRKRMWSRFVFANINATFYMPVMRKALARLRTARVGPMTTEVSLFSDIFVCETLSIYEQVMTTDPGDQKMFMLLAVSNSRRAHERVRTTQSDRQQQGAFLDT